MSEELEQAQTQPRSAQIYVSYDLWAQLGYAATATGQVRDAIAEVYIREGMRREHPLIVEFVEARSQQDKTFRRELKAIKHQRT